MVTYKPFSRDDQQEVLLTGVITHQADPPYPGLGHGTLAHLRGFLPEEEVQLVIILFSAVWDEVCVDECGIYEEERGDGVGVSGFFMLLDMLTAPKCSDSAAQEGLVHGMVNCDKACFNLQIIQSNIKWTLLELKRVHKGFKRDFTQTTVRYNIISYLWETGTFMSLQMISV